MRVGLVINPIAGMGGAVGLKGTDSKQVLEEAIKRGARPLAQERTIEALKAVGPLEGYKFFTAGGKMGAEALMALTGHFTVVYAPNPTTSEEDTKEACIEILKAGADIIMFTGGDGTARDVMDAVGEKVPVIGIPSGVKMHSGVFANTPRAAGILLRRVRVESLPSERAEVMDIDEDGVRMGRMSASLYGYMLTPHEPTLMQPFKLALGGDSEDEQKEAIAKFLVEGMHQETLYILGPGTTVEAVGKELGVDKTLLGVDAILNGKLLAKDADEDVLLKLLGTIPEATIVVSPIGAQGFIFGRGNQQISPRVIRKVGIRNVVVLATPLKVKETKIFRVDTGDGELDEELRGYGKVIIGYGREMIVPIS